MTKAEIIRKLAKRVGVHDLDAKIFFEVFLRKVSLQFNPGETIKIKNFGFLQMHTGKLKNISQKYSESLLVDLMVFYPLQNEQDESNEKFIFNVPGKKEDENNIIDSYFSLSFGKPVIPLKDAIISEYFIPPTGNELRRLFDSKADKLLKEVEVVENFTKKNEILLIDPELIDPNQMEINWDEINNGSVSSENNIGDTEQNSLKDPNAFSWEFGDELEKQIEEESLLDTENEDNLFADYDDLKDISWDFGDHIEKKEPEEFQRVKSSISEFNIDHTNTSSTALNNENDSDLIKSINEELNDEGFAEIKHIPYNYNPEPDLTEKISEDIRIPEIVDEKSDYDDIKNLSSEPEPLPSYTIPSINESNLNYSKKKGIGLYLIFVFIFIVCGAVYLYLKFVLPYYSGSKKIADAKVSVYNIPPVIIERDFDIPVTYPYPKDSNIVSSFDPIDKSVFEKNESRKDDDLKVVLKQSAQTITNKTVLAPAIKVKDFIYKSGDKYIVQISSWSSEKSALKHASYFKEKGYQTEIIKAKLDRGTWYRVRVINFYSENEAVKFYNKYK
jgi:hypothetical protein